VTTGLPEPAEGQKGPAQTIRKDPAVRNEAMDGRTSASDWAPHRQIGGHNQHAAEHVEVPDLW
jgi:hypothetical protein